MHCTKGQPKQVTVTVPIMSGSLAKDDPFHLKKEKLCQMESAQNMGHRCLSANHSFPPPAPGHLCVIVQSHISPLLLPNDHLPPAWGHLHIIIGIHMSPVLSPTNCPLPAQGCLHIVIETYMSPVLSPANCPLPAQGHLHVVIRTYVSPVPSPANHPLPA